MTAIVDRSLTAFCKRHGISLTTGYKLAREDKLDVRKLGGRAVVTEAAEADFLKNLPKWTPTAPDDHRREHMRKFNERKRAARASTEQPQA